MSVISEQLEILAGIKNDIKAAIIDKGQTVGDDFSTYATAIENIEGGGGENFSTQVNLFDGNTTALLNTSINIQEVN